MRNRCAIKSLFLQNWWRVSYLLSLEKLLQCQKIDKNGTKLIWIQFQILKKYLWGKPGDVNRSGFDKGVRQIRKLAFPFLDNELYKRILGCLMTKFDILGQLGKWHWRTDHDSEEKGKIIMASGTQFTNSKSASCSKHKFLEIWSTYSEELWLSRPKGTVIQTVLFFNFAE